MDFMFRSLKTAQSAVAAAGLSSNDQQYGGAAAYGLGASGPEPSSPSLILESNTKNEIADLTSKLQQTRRQMAAGASATLGMPGGKGKKGGHAGGSGRGGGGPAGTVKAISVKDERILNQAIDYVNEISAR